MPRANRYFIPGFTWHITHRCHKKEFLLKFSKDRERFIYWLFEAKKRYGLKVLNYMVTSNHIHLLVSNNPDSERDIIPKSMQLIAGRTAQEYNQRKNRKGAFWEDRYHATAVDDQDHLFKCLFYIDLNMVRAGVVKHPLDWESCGLHEILTPKKRYSIIDHPRLLNLTGVYQFDKFKEQYLNNLEQQFQNQRHKRDDRWSESIAVGNKNFIKQIRERLKSKIKKRKNITENDLCQIREEIKPYIGSNDSDNMIFWDQRQA